MEDRRDAVFFGASRGIGRTLALEAARRGIRPRVIARSFDPDDTELKDAAFRITTDVSTAAGMDILKRAPIWLHPYVFWMAGGFRRSPLADMGDGYIDRMLDTHQRALVETVREFHRYRLTMRDQRGAVAESLLPYTLVVIGSISSYKHRRHESVYAMAKAGQAAFLRTYAPELAEDFPGSKILLVNCARLGTEPGEQKLDAGGRLIDPGFVAKLIWNLLQGDGKITNRPFTQVNIERNSDGPILSYGPQLPEIP